MEGYSLFNCVHQTVNEIVTLIDPATPSDLDIRELRLRYDRALQIQGKAGVSKVLGLTAAELEQGFGPALRRALAFAADDSSHGVDRTIAYLRFLNWAETVADKPGIALSVSNLPQETPEILAQKQVRALELVLRALVTEHYQSQDKLISRLKSLFKSDVVQQWLRDATKGDVLSGTLFSDLASIFTHKQEFQNYEHIYSSSNVLTFLKHRRDTIRYFLEDIRFLRNRIAHHRPLKPAQIELLNIYYEQVVEPIQLIFDQGSTRVNPDALLDTDDSSLHVYFSRLKADMSTLDERTLTISHGVEEIKAGVGDIRRRTGVILAGVALSVIAIGATFWRLGFIGHDTKEIRSAVEEENTQIGNVAEDVKKTKKETSSDPRKELANMGIQWSTQSFVDALMASDARTVRLFLAGGMAANTVHNGASAILYIFQPNLPDPVPMLKLIFASGYDANVTLIDTRVLALYGNLLPPHFVAPGLPPEYAAWKRTFAGPALLWVVILSWYEGPTQSDRQVIQFLLQHGADPSLSRAFLKEMEREGDTTGSLKEVRRLIG
jgi:hypothetical protein